MDGITLKWKGIDTTRRQMLAVKNLASNPDTSGMVREVAGVWAENFRGEGSMVGGWRELAESTQRLRESRGFPPDHPILVQTGTLRRVAIEYLLASSGPRSAFGPGVALSYTTGPLSAKLRVSGAKVDNQFRIRDRRAGTSQPPRPFWFVNPQVNEAAARGLNKWLSDSLRKL
jgi:hypothetical protein